MTQTNILIVVPTAGGLNEVTAAAVSALSQNAGVSLFISKGSPHDYARNRAVRHFLTQPDLARCTHLLFIDSDIEPPQNVVEKLLAAKAPVVTGCYPLAMQNGLRWAICRQESDGRYYCLKHRESITERFRVDACGAGCLMVRRDVFETLGRPWFKWVEEADGHRTGEDVYFGIKCGEHNIPILCDPTVVCEHFKTLGLLGMMLATDTLKKECEV